MWPNIARSVVTLSATPCRCAGARRDAQGAHADGGDLARRRAVGVDPHAWILVLAASPRQPEVGQRGDDDLLQPVHVRRPDGRVVGHGDDRIGHQLAGPVVGDVAAPVGPLEHGADRRRVDQHVAVSACAPSVYTCGCWRTSR